MTMVTLDRQLEYFFVTSNSLSLLGTTNQTTEIIVKNLESDEITTLNAFLVLKYTVTLNSTLESHQ